MIIRIDREALESLCRMIDYPIAELRIAVSEDGTRKDAKAELQGFSKGDLIRRHIEQQYGVIGEADLLATDGT